MGYIVSSRRFSSQKTGGLLKPIIYCCKYKSIDEQAYSLNRPLSEALIQFSPRRRTMQIEKCVVEVIRALPEDPIIKNFDVLFNPDYKVDVLKILVNVCKIKSFSIIWPGRLDGDRLIYAEEQYRDYKEFAVDDYDITCVI